jgi:hypothetical protein
MIRKSTFLAGAAALALAMLQAPRAVLAHGHNDNYYYDSDQFWSGPAVTDVVVIGGSDVNVKVDAEANAEANAELNAEANGEANADVSVDANAAANADPCADPNAQLDYPGLCLDGD